MSPLGSTLGQEDDLLAASTFTSKSRGTPHRVYGKGQCKGLSHNRRVGAELCLYHFGSITSTGSYHFPGPVIGLEHTDTKGTK